MTKKILCICDWGEVRSVALSNMIKDLNSFADNEYNEDVKFEALPIGIESFIDKSINYFLAWADISICLTKEANDRLFALNANIYYFFDIGPDIYGNSEDGNLKNKLRPIVDKIKKGEI